MASMEVGWSGRYSVGGLVMRTMSVFGFRTTGMSGTRWRFVTLSNQSLKIDSLITMNLC